MLSRFNFAVLAAAGVPAAARLCGCRRLVAARAFSLSSITQREVPQTPPATEENATQETQDVADLDGLLKAVKDQVDPEHAMSMPMRSPTLWSEELLRASLPSLRAPSPGSDASSGGSSPNGAGTPASPEPRRMHDSYSEILLPFARNPQLLDQYVNASGGLQTGKLMENLDSLAGSIAYKHMLGPGAANSARDVRERKFYIVTASCDRLDMLAPLYPPVRDVRLSGQVIYVGRSSMEIVVKMEALEEDSTATTVLLGRFSMVCRDAFTQRAREVNPLIVSTPEEKALHAMGEAHKNRRQSLAARSLTRMPPTSSEAETLHAFYLDYGRETGNTILQEGEERVWMGDTALEVCQLMLPQQRNLHSKVFGGYLMRLAYELGFTGASLFARAPVRFLSLDKIAFAAPVPIGSILRLSARVLHTAAVPRYPVLIHVGVQADVVDVQTGARRTTNDFRFTWGQEHGEPLARKVVPRTYREAMLWLEAKRALEMNTLLRRKRE